MTVSATPHLNFRGDAREALTFYRTAFGGDLVLVTYADAGAVQDPAEADHVMWGQVTARDGFRVMAYDVPGQLAWAPGENAFFVSLRGEGAEEVTALWERLTEGATVRRPLGPAPWAPLYGMLEDKFGVTWVLDVAYGAAG
ncbi:VOC family protein [Streptomyces avicenniae]|uniref:VOC family protein n=1 Tax=Streptomyces avicenniae TaxID=500153 RepID=UPI00069B8FA4|nr:VOC family protein [Streptomyces avicenniae]